MTARMLGSSLVLLVICPLARAADPIVDEYVVASGQRYGEQAHILGNLVVWQTHGPTEATGSINLRSMARPDSATLRVATYPTGSTGLFLSD